MLFVYVIAILIDYSYRNLVKGNVCMAYEGIKVKPDKWTLRFLSNYSDDILWDETYALK